ncbi:MAG: hypothetical protein CVU65_05345 [Deltaproteobacteria bacterium HGW-Deltaproteobacteria-22]|jgi:hypothetical protein|nr:MAG: hypothetical protein CVU65_05345 [Deltaproteobacteria bacterium HGW-Deltaproteobacteria-22]
MICTMNHTTLKLDARNVQGRLGLVTIGRREFQIQTELNSQTELRLQSIVVMAGRLVYQRDEPVDGVTDANECQRRLGLFHDESIQLFCNYVKKRLDEGNTPQAQRWTELACVLRAFSQVDMVLLMNQKGVVQKTTNGRPDDMDLVKSEDFLELWTSGLGEALIQGDRTPLHVIVEVRGQTFFCRFLSRDQVLVAALNDRGALALVKCTIEEITS